VSAKYLEYWILILFIIAEIFPDRESLAKIMYTSPNSARYLHIDTMLDARHESVKKYVKMQKGNVTRGS